MHNEQLISSASAAVSPRPVRKRRQNGRARLPAKTQVRTRDGGNAVAVALHGIHGRGKWMILDGRDWFSIRTTIGDVWGLNPNGRRTHFHVRCGAARLAVAADQRGSRPTASLARILTNAGRGEVVLYRDGDTLNLRRANLEVVPRAEAMRRRFIAPASA